MELGILRDVVERHADEAAFLWSQRQRGSRSPLFDAATLSDWDDRLAANLEGLVIAEGTGLEICIAALEGGAAGRLFTACHVAGELGDTVTTAKLLVSADERHSRQQEVISAIAWFAPIVAKHVLGGMTDERAPLSSQCLAIRGLGARGDDSHNEVLARAFASGEPGLQQAAAEAAGKLSRQPSEASFLPALQKLYANATSGPLALAAARSAALLGDVRAVEALWSLIANEPPATTSSQHLQMRNAVRHACVAPDGLTADKLIRLAEDPDTQAWALAGAAALGDPACIPIALELAAEERVSRLAGWAYASMTGLTLEPPFAVRPATVDPTPEQVVRRAFDAFEDLPLPAHDELTAHWNSVRASFQQGTRYLGGVPLSDTTLLALLRTGKQPWRYDSALTLAHRGVLAPLFLVHAPSPVQQRRLAALASQ